MGSIPVTSSPNYNKQKVKSIVTDDVPVTNNPNKDSVREVKGRKKTTKLSSTGYHMYKVSNNFGTMWVQMVNIV